MPQSDTVDQHMTHWGRYVRTVKQLAQLFLSEMKAKPEKTLRIV